MRTSKCPALDKPLQIQSRKKISVCELVKCYGEWQIINKTSKKNILCLMKSIAMEKNKAKRVTKNCLVGVGH